MPISDLPARAIVAIPASNEAERIERCLSALAMQRDRGGAPLRDGLFEILVFANNCSDDTATIAAAVGAQSPHRVIVVSETLGPDRANAGWARRRAMDLAADRLTDVGTPGGVILTTDADSLAAPTWVEATLRAFDEGADGVAGYVDADPVEMVRLGRAFMARGRLEERYMAAMAEIHALCDPRPHDPWPCHQVSAGASLAVTLQAYRAIGGLPVRAVGEDAALSVVLEDGGFRIRHAMDVCVTTSMRFDGRVMHGAAETMRHRHENADAPCDADFEPALAVVRRALHKGRLRRIAAAQGLAGGAWGARLGLSTSEAAALALPSASGFETCWQALREASPVLRPRVGLRPSDLPREIQRAELCLKMLRRAALISATGGRADRFGR